MQSENLEPRYISYKELAECESVEEAMILLGTRLLS